MKPDLFKEQDFIDQIKRHLDHGAQQLDKPTLDQLMSARQRALASQSTTQAIELRLAGFTATLSASLLPRARLLAMLATLLVGVIGLNYWINHQQSTEIEEIDTALLSDELPINAYLDHGFQTWLER
jgi:hypothetical protein